LSWELSALLVLIWGDGWETDEEGEGFSELRDLLFGERVGLGKSFNQCL
jgi:hypothetical protein